LSFFDGNITQDEFITDIRRLSPLLGLNETDHSEIFGFYCYGEVSESGENHIHRDVLGNYPLFIAYNDNVTAISNNPYLAAQALYGAHWQKHKNIYALGNVVMNGEIADNEMTFKSVYCVPQNAGIMISEKNDVLFYSMINNMYYPMRDEEWNGHLDETRKQMVRFLKNYAGGSEVGGNITGGYDSRVLLALTIEAGIHQNISYTVNGYEDHPDVIIAKQIAKHFGLNLTRIDSVIQDADKNIIKTSFEKTLEQYASVAGTISFNERWIGSISSEISKLQQNQQAKIARNLLMGVAIEQCRGYFSLHLLDGGVANKSIGSNERKHLLSDRTTHTDRYTQKANEYFINIYNRTIDSFDELYSVDLLLNRIRLPQFHAGLNRKNRNWFCALGYNSWLHRLAMIQAPEKRAVADIPFRLIEQSAPELLYFPFASKSWKYTAFAHRTDAEQFLQIKPVENTANRPLPSGSNLTDQICFLIENNIELDSSIFEVFDEKWFYNAVSDAKLQIAGQKPIARLQLAQIIDIYGASLFMQNKEGNLSVNCAVPVPFYTQKLVSQINPLYTPNKNWYTEPAEQVLRNGELCFGRWKVFLQSDHNRLSDHEKFIFALDMEHGKFETKLKETENARQWYINTIKKIESEKNALRAEYDKLKSEFANKQNNKSGA
jgi:hypothetical protein